MLFLVCVIVYVCVCVFACTCTCRDHRPSLNAAAQYPVAVTVTVTPMDLSLCLFSASIAITCHCVWPFFFCFEIGFPVPQTDLKLTTWLNLLLSHSKGWEVAGPCYHTWLPRYSVGFVKSLSDLRIKGFHLIVGSGIIAFSPFTDSKAFGLVGNFSETLTDDCRYSWPLYIPGSTTKTCQSRDRVLKSLL